MLEDNTFLAKPIKASSPKKLPLDYIVKAPPNAAKVKNNAEKPNHNMECSAENIVGKASLSSVQNGSQPPSYKPFSASSPVTSLTGDPNMGSWGFNQTPGQHHQWLIPVMSPSEGLVYKPYPGPGYMAPACGGCGPPGAMPMMGNFFNPAYGIPASNYYQSIGVPPLAAPTGPHGYIPPYGMPVLNQAPMSGSAVDQSNHFAASGFHGKSACKSPGGGANSNIQHQSSSSNLPSPKHGANVAIPNVTKVRPSRDSEVQVSTASSPSERRVEGIGRVNNNSLEGNNVLSLFPTSPVTDPSGKGTQPQVINLPTRVIRVVPHNGRSATESAARIFQSIQEERKQYDSV